MSRVRVILKSGAEFVVLCKDCKITTSSLTNALCGYSLSGISENNPLFIDLSEIAAVIEENPFEGQ